jgi:glycine oxidase
VGVYGTANGGAWLGGTEDRTGFDLTPTASARQRISRGIAQLLPALADVPIAAHTAGLRPVTPDGLPLSGRPDGWENVCLALGGGRKGMLLGAGLGMAATELLTVGATDMAIAPCSPDRWSAG